MKKKKGLSEKVKLLSTKSYNFWLFKKYFTGNDGYQNFLVFAPLQNSLALHNNKKVTNWIPTGVSPKKVRAFVNLTLTMTNLVNGRVSL